MAGGSAAGGGKAGPDFVALYQSGRRPAIDKDVAAACEPVGEAPSVSGGTYAAGYWVQLKELLGRQVGTAAYPACLPSWHAWGLVACTSGVCLAARTRFCMSRHCDRPLFCLPPGHPVLAPAPVQWPAPGGGPGLCPGGGVPLLQKGPGGAGQPHHRRAQREGSGVGRLGLGNVAGGLAQRLHARCSRRPARRAHNHLMAT